MKKKLKALLRKIFPAYRVALRIENRMRGESRSDIGAVPRPMLHFEMHLAEHCNLNCAGCTHFSPLAQPELLEPGEYERDIKRLSALFGGEMQLIKLMGGEPLLNPQVTEFMRLTRESFPVGMILLVTNGILLPKQDEAFWLACKKYRVHIAISLYPCKIDYDAGRALAEKYGVRFDNYDSYLHSGNGKRDTLWRFLLEPDGQRDPRISFSRCAEANRCNFFSHGRMFPCPEASCARHFAKYFDVELHQSKNDYVDIYEVSTGAELLERLTRPIPFCRYCNKEDVVDNVPWHVSNRDIKEWTL